LLNRIDVVYLEVNEEVGTRANSIAVATGTPASTPVAPTLTDTGTIHQYPLAEIYVAAAVTEIVQDDITNKVGSVDTPFVAGIIDYVTTNEILIQWEAQWETWFDSIKDQLSTEAETNLQAQIWDLAGVGSGAPPYADDMVTLAAHDHAGTHPQIPSGGIASGAIIPGKLSALAVQAGNIATGAINAAAQLASNVVETSKIKNLNVTSGKLAANAVIAGKIADGAVDTAAILANDIVDDTKVGDRVAQVYRRQGGLAGSWQAAGTTAFSPGPVRIQCGTIGWTGSSAPSGTKLVTFPIEFGDPPIHFVQAYSLTDPIVVTTVTSNAVPPFTTGLQIFWETHDGSNLTSVTFYWMAIGPE
jgi:hypothetical protein